MPKVYSSMIQSTKCPQIAQDALLEPLCNIIVDISTLFVPFHIVLVDQSSPVSTVSLSRGKKDILLYILLDIRGIKHAPSLCCGNDFANQLCMRDGLSPLHYPDNSRLRFIVAIRSYTLVCLLILLLSFFGLNLVDLDAIPRVGEIEIDREGICVIDVFTFRLFIEDPVLSAGKGLERPLEFGIV